MSRKYNFAAGPSTIPLEVLEQLQEEIVDYHGLGFSLIETSHRGKEYDQVHNNAINLVRELLQIPDNFKILFLGGGATLQFSLIPLNFMGQGNSCDFTITGTWSKKAYLDAIKVGNVNILFDGKEDKYMSLPDPVSIEVNDGSSYLHITTNETIQGTQWQSFPDTGSVPIIADMSSDIMSRSLPMDKFGVIYAGAQKNLGPSGVALVIVRDDLLKRCPDSLTAYLNYSIHSSKNSLYNTPPVFPIYAIYLVLKRLKKLGGVKAAAERAEKKSSILYEAIKESDGFYLCPVEEKVRSKMNVVFRLSDENLEEKFLKEGAREGLIGLKGHRSVGGLRASIYNAMPLEGVSVLGQFMKYFVEKN